MGLDDLKKRWANLSSTQMEIAIVVGILAGLAVLAIIAFMLVAWGVMGLLWRVVAVAVLGGGIWLAWRYRRELAAMYRQKAATGAQRRRTEAARRQQAANALQVAMTPRVAMASNQAVDAIPVSSVDWVGPDSPTSIGRFQIPRPMTYIQKDNRVQPQLDEPSLLIPRLAVASGVQGGLAGLPYWPCYWQMDMEQRWVYLVWMETGRAQLPPQIGYVFVFFYGLERRALIERKDHKLIFDEVMRLRDLHAAAGQDRFSWSFENYTSSFLWFLVTCYPQNFGEKNIRRLTDSMRSWSEENLSAALSWFIQSEQPLPAWAAYVVASQMPDAKRSVVVDRVNDEFRDLFDKRYQEQFGDGIQVRSSKRQFTYTYKPASGALRTWTAKGPNPLGIMSQFKGLDETWNSCIDDLRKLSSRVREGEGELTPEAYEAMPEEIRAGIDHPMTDDICRLVIDCTDEQNRTLIPVSRLAELFEVEREGRLTPTQSKMICRTVGHVGYRLEPDAYYTASGYKLDEKVAAFLKVTDDDTDHARYNAAACMLRLGLVIASADGTVHEDELTTIAHSIEHTFDLNPQEQRRLEALKTLLLAEGTDTKGMSKMLKKLKAERREAIAKLLVSLVAADGLVTKEEIRALRKCYNQLGFEKSDIDHALAQLRGGAAEGPVTIRPGKPAAAGEAIPVAPQEEAFELDHSAIEAIMKDTREVARLLAEAMAQEESESDEPAAPVPEDRRTRPATKDIPVPTNVTIPTQTMSEALGEQFHEETETDDATLPARYAEFYQVLITKAEWTKQDVEELARRHGLMRAGAIDALNEWSTDKYGGQLFIEEGARLVVEQEYLN